MAFKPGRPDPDDVDLDKLRTILNQTKLAVNNNPLYQFCNALLNGLTKQFGSIRTAVKTLEESTSGSGGGGGSTPTTAAFDYVVLSDGATPTPSPIDDGFGNFVYIPYEP